MRFFGFLEPARIEFEEAINFYNQQRENLGDEFAAEVLNAINRILSHPEAWTKAFQKNPAVPDKTFSVRRNLSNSRRQDSNSGCRSLKKKA